MNFSQKLTKIDDANRTIEEIGPGLRIDFSQYLQGLKRTISLQFITDELKKQGVKISYNGLRFYFSGSPKLSVRKIPLLYQAIKKIVNAHNSALIGSDKKNVKPIKKV